MGGLFSQANEHGAPAQPTAASAPVKTAQLTDHERAVLQLKVSRDKLQKYEKKAERELGILIDKVKEQLKIGKRDKAAIILKTKRVKEQKLKQLRGQLDNVAKMIDSVETAQMTNEIFKALESGNKTLKALNEEMPLDKLEQIMEETAEAVAYQEEVQAILSNSLTKADESAIDEELAALQEEFAPAIKLPEAPTTPVKLPEPASPEPEPSIRTRVAERG